MRKFLLFFIAIISTGIVNFAYSQFEHSLLFLNLKRNIPSNFANIEWQLGNNEMHFFTMQAGYNFSNYSSEKYCPYFTNTLDLNVDFSFSEYISKKNGWNAGLGYNYYFVNVENEKEFIPCLGMDMTWYRIQDNFTLEYTNSVNNDISKSTKENSIDTFSASIHGGFIYTGKKMFFKAIFAAEFYLPVNTTFYLPSDSYNLKSSRKLPFNGFEPGIQIGVGIALF